jgi:hypothetical protein
MSLVEKWMELEIVMLSEISQTQKAFCSHMDSRPKMIIIAIIMGHECKGGLSEGRSVGEGRVKEKRTEGEHN